MKFLRIVIQKGERIHHLNSDVTFAEFEAAILKDKPFTTTYKDYAGFKINPDEVISWREMEIPDGEAPTFQY